MEDITATVANLTAAISQLAVGGGSGSRRDRGKWNCFDGVWWWGQWFEDGEWWWWSSETSWVSHTSWSSSLEHAAPSRGAVVGEPSAKRPRRD